MASIPEVTGAIDRIVQEAITPAAATKRPTRAAKTSAKRTTGRASSKAAGAKKSAPPRAPGKTAGPLRKTKGLPGARRTAFPRKIGRQRRLTKRR
jgi:hypothetical protein